MRNIKIVLCAATMFAALIFTSKPIEAAPQPQPTHVIYDFTAKPDFMGAMYFDAAILTLQEVVAGLQPIALPVSPKDIPSNIPDVCRPRSGISVEK
jgi:hypothetical protein